ncbi:MAG: hypothetical protein O3C43_05640 [Verrucomicrobia bacterium]|nr:hypothetical protein [Verrucomicrobiota bacterium]MDA1065966.1 hypothetical protein [Verrucomicrobiota bacterium]
MSKKTKKTHAITPWKNVAFYLCILLFILSTIDYFARGNYGDGLWLWPLMFVPLILYFLGIMYGDVPSRFYQLSGLQPFPIPFSMQFDRAVLAVVLLFSGITLNGVLLVLSLLFSAPFFMTTLYVVYMVIVLIELPHSIRIFRYLQHIQIMRMNAEDATSLFKNTNAYRSNDGTIDQTGPNPKFLEEIYEELKKEGEALVQKYSPLGIEQQYALNLAVRAGEAVWAARASAEAGAAEDLETNLNVVYALCKHADMEPPSDLNDLTKQLKELLESKEREKSVESTPAPAG